MHVSTERPAGSKSAMPALSHTGDNQAKIKTISEKAFKKSKGEKLTMLVLCLVFFFFFPGKLIGDENLNQV